MWDVTPYNLVYRYQNYESMCRRHIQCARVGTLCQYTQFNISATFSFIAPKSLRSPQIKYLITEHHSIGRERSVIKKKDKGLIFWDVTQCPWASNFPTFLRTVVTRYSVSPGACPKTQCSVTPLYKSLNLAVPEQA